MASASTDPFGQQSNCAVGQMAGTPTRKHMQEARLVLTDGTVATVKKVEAFPNNPAVVRFEGKTFVGGPRVDPEYAGSLDSQLIYNEQAAVTIRK